MSNTYTIFNDVIVGGTELWPSTANINDWGVGFPPTNTPILLRATVYGTGTVTATYTIYHGSFIHDTVVYDTAPIATITLSGANIDTGSTLFAISPNRYWKIVLSGLTGTNAHTSCVAEY